MTVVDKVIVVWLIGSNASGKTTQAKMLHNSLGNKPKQILRGEDYKITTFGNIINLGEVNDNQCTGADTLKGKVEFIKSFEVAMKLRPVIIIVDAIMATGQFIEFLNKPNVILFPILLDYITVNSNIDRIKQRRAKKKSVDPDSIQIDEKTYKNIEGKIRGFRSLFEKAKVVSKHHLKCIATNPATSIHDEILSSIEEIVLTT